MTSRQMQAVELMALGSSDHEVAEAISVSISTIKRWRRDSEFAECLEKFLTFATQDVQNACRANAEQAFMVLKDIMQNGPPRERLAAANRILELAGVREPQKGDNSPADIWMAIFNGPVQTGGLPAITNPYLQKAITDGSLTVDVEEET